MSQRLSYNRFRSLLASISSLEICILLQMPAKNVELLEAEWIARSGRGSCDVLSQHWYNSSSPSVTLINDFVSASSSALECWEQLHTINIFHNYLVQCVEDVFSSAFGKFHLKANYFEGKCCKYIIESF